MFDNLLVIGISLAQLPMRLTALSKTRWPTMKGQHLNSPNRVPNTNYESVVRVSKSKIQGSSLLLLQEIGDMSTVASMKNIRKITDSPWPSRPFSVTSSN